MAGFAGLVSAFHTERVWNVEAFVRLQSLVIAAFAVTFMALWPVVALFAGVTDRPDLWRAASAVMLVYHLQILVRRARALRRVGRPLSSLVRWYVGILVYPLQIVQLLNIVWWGSFGAVAAGVFTQIWIASAFFYGFVLDVRREPATHKAH